MKKQTFLTFYLSFLILAFAGIGIYQNLDLPKVMEFVHLGLMLVVVGIGLYQGYTWIKGRHEGQPADDEFSIKILHRSASSAFLLALLLWSGLSYLFVKSDIDAGIIIDAGIMGMVLIFVLSWFYYKNRVHA